MTLLSQTACCDMLMIINRICFIYLWNRHIFLGKEAVVWYFLNSCVALIKTNYSLCSILQSCVECSTVSKDNLAKLWAHRPLLYIFRLWLTVLLIFSPGPTHEWKFHAAHHIISEGILTFSFCGATAENTCASPAGVPLQVEGVFMCL